MSDTATVETGAIEGAENVNIETGSSDSQDLSNADIKGHPLFQKVTGELAKLQSAEEERKATEEKAAQEAAIKEAESKQDYEKVKELHSQEIESLKTTHAQQIQERDLKTELLKAGFANDVFLTGAVGKYDAEKSGSIADYVKALAEDESNKAFMGNGGRVPPVPPPGTPPPGGPGALTKEQALSYEKSDDPEKKKLARAYLEAYYRQHGEMP